MKSARPSSSKKNKSIKKPEVKSTLTQEELNEVAAFLNEVHSPFGGEANRWKAQGITVNCNGPEVGNSDNFMHKLSQHSEVSPVDFQNVIFFKKTLVEDKLVDLNNNTINSKLAAAGFDEKFRKRFLNHLETNIQTYCSNYEISDPGFLRELLEHKKMYDAYEQAATDVVTQFVQNPSIAKMVTSGYTLGKENKKSSEEQPESVKNKDELSKSQKKA